MSKFVDKTGVLKQHHPLIIIKPSCYTWLLIIFTISPPPLITQRKQIYEKIGEPTEVALKVLAEKANVLGVDRSDMTAHDKSCACFKASKSEFEKIFTLEFSRDRKSMSVYCKKDNQPLMFVKVCCIIIINIAVLVNNCRKLPSRQLVSFISVVPWFL